ncbi:hypothetical protein JCM1393_08810 [Clostridium carnis]
MLNGNNDVMIYDRKIYLPTLNQVKYYIPLYKKLKNSGEIKFKKSIEEFEKIVRILREISDDISIDEGVKSYVTNLLTPKFYFEKSKDTILCSVKLDYLGKIIDIIKDYNNKDFIRNLKKEDEIDRELEKFRFIKKNNVFTFIGDDNEMYNLLSYGLDNLRIIGEVYLSPSFNEVKFLNKDFLRCELLENNNGFIFKYGIETLSGEELQGAMMAFKEGNRFFKTKNNSFLDLDDSDVIMFFNLLEEIISGKELNGTDIKIDKFKGVYINEKLRRNRLAFIKGGECLTNIIERILNRKFKTIEAPKELNAKLRSYQLIGYNWLNELSVLELGGILADEMGLGKTLQTITFLLSKKGSKSLIITPTSLIYNWKDEFDNFTKGFKIGVMHGSLKERSKIIEDIEKYDVILTSYGTLRNDYKLYENKFFDYCIIDEAQNIKNSTSKITSKVKDINARCKFALTGTPIENNLKELWSIFDFIMPGYLNNEEAFKRKFINSGDKNIQELKDLINPFILRRLKKDVLIELPDKIEKKYLVEMTPSQKQVYKGYIKEVREKIKNNKEDRITIFSYLTKLRRLCLDPSLLLENYCGGSGKLKISMEIINNRINLNKKIIIFSQFTSVLKKIGNELKVNNKEFLYLDGGTNAKERINLVNKFNESKDINIFLISLKAGGTGLNLTSANVVIHFDPWWNPAIEDQATDRAHRIGQKNIVEIIKLVAKDTIEEKIIKLQQDKKELINDVINGEVSLGDGIRTLTNDEIIALFS